MTTSGGINAYDARDGSYYFYDSDWNWIAGLNIYDAGDGVYYVYDYDWNWLGQLSPSKGVAYNGVVGSTKGNTPPASNPDAIYTLRRPRGK